MSSVSIVLSEVTQRSKLRLLMGTELRSSVYVIVKTLNEHLKQGRHLEVAVLRGDHDARLELVLYDGHVQVGRANVHVALVRVLRATIEVGHQARKG